MMARRQLLRVKRDPVPKIVRLPVDTWRETIFVEADGTELVVVCSGKMPSRDWPEGMDVSKERLPARVHIRKRS